MSRKHILHMLTPLAHMSPFDVNMALDAGFDAVVPYVGVGPGEVTGGLEPVGLAQAALRAFVGSAGADSLN